MSASSAFNSLPQALTAAQGILTQPQIVELFSKIAEKCEWSASSAFNSLPQALAGTKEGLTIEQIMKRLSV